MKSNCHGACCYCTDCKHEIDECVCGRFGMKDKISVDEHVNCFCPKCVSGKTIQLPTANVDNKSHCVQCHVIDQHIKKHLEYNPCKISSNFIYTAEVERLKRMENNIKRMIKDLDGMLSQEMAACGETKLMSNIKELLEALLK
jgi:Zn ribbon nucleic-acid-binding protein